ncbi:hypothetical protein BDB01DRAFT_567298 [Pilobolus umbonatus]|nr:hypothetical protein BDB01DRAFT_567298 [Pilobolus umbonatus]
MSDSTHLTPPYLNDMNSQRYYSDINQYAAQTIQPPQTIRTVYLGNVSNDVAVSDIVDQVKSGPIQSIRPLPEKNGLFITFIDSGDAAHFYHEAQRKHLSFNGTELKIGWGKASPITPNIQMALQNGATRNVYLGSLDDTISEEELREDLSRFGHIEHIKILPEKHIAFVHFLCISNAVKCVNTLPTESKWQSKRVNYGKDRCTQHHKPLTLSPNHPYPPSQLHKHLIRNDTNRPTLSPIISSSNTHRNINNSIMSFTPSPTQSTQNRFSLTYDLYSPIDFYAPLSPLSPLSPPPLPSSTSSTITQGVANRTIYLGNIHPDTTAEDICNVIRGGILSHIRFMPDKRITFITFVDPQLASNFFHQSSYQHIIIKNRRIKVGWGKPTALSANVIHAVQNGGSRNVYIGNINESITEDKLKHDFSEYGDIELVNTLKEKNCAFVNFTSIAGAIRAIEGIRTKEEYKGFRINYGKDRCGNPPRIQALSPNKNNQPSPSSSSHNGM